MDQLRTILLIDDDADDREMFRTLVADIDEGINCMVAKDAEVARLLFDSSDTISPELIFVDMNLPRISGDQFIKQFKRTDVGRDIPVIVYSATKVPVEIQAELFGLGVTNFLIKVSSLREMRLQILNMLVQFNIYRPSKIANQG